MSVHVSWRCGKDFPRPPLPLLRRTVRAIMRLADPSLSSVMISFLAPDEMARLNERFLGHSGATDVICFDYRSDDIPRTDEDDDPEVELLICPAVALRESRKRGLSYSSEVTLYLIHGLLHAGGFDDLQPALKRRMRAAERRVKKALPPGADMIFPDPAEGGAA